MPLREGAAQNGSGRSPTDHVTRGDVLDSWTVLLGPRGVAVLATCDSIMYGMLNIWQAVIQH